MCHSVTLFTGGVSVWKGPEGRLSRGVSVRETPLYGKERAVCILLECTLVDVGFSENLAELCPGA